MMDNKLIAEFMGEYLPSNTGMMGFCKEDIEDLETLKYHTSWNWLMPVINKIRSMDSTYEVEEVGKYDWDNEISHYEFDLELTYESVVEFIKEYNEQDRFLCGVCGEHVNEYTYNEDKDVDECNKCKL